MNSSGDFVCSPELFYLKTASQWKHSIPKTLTNSQLRKMYRRWFLTFPTSCHLILTNLNEVKAVETSPVFSSEPWLSLCRHVSGQVSEHLLYETFLLWQEWILYATQTTYKKALQCCAPWCASQADYLRTWVHWVLPALVTSQRNYLIYYLIIL